MSTSPLCLESNKIERAKVIPFRDDDGHVRLVGRLERAVAPYDARQQRSCILARMRIVSSDRRTTLLKHGNEDQARGLAHIVGVGLKGDTQHGDGLAGKRSAGGTFDAAGHGDLALRVHRLHLLDQ
jgi:hypothetical protein